MAPRTKAAKKQAEAPVKAKKAAAKKGAARILLPSGVQGDEPQPKSKKKTRSDP